MAGISADAGAIHRCLRINREELDLWRTTEHQRQLHARRTLLRDISWWAQTPLLRQVEARRPRPVAVPDLDRCLDGLACLSCAVWTCQPARPRTWSCSPCGACIGDALPPLHCALLAVAWACAAAASQPFLALMDCACASCLCMIAPCGLPGKGPCCSQPSLFDCCPAWPGKEPCCCCCCLQRRPAACFCCCVLCLRRLRSSPSSALMNQSHACLDA